MVFIFRLGYKSKPPVQALDPVYATLLNIYASAIFSTSASVTKESALSELSDNPRVKEYLAQLEKDVGGKEALKAKLLEILQDPALKDKYKGLEGLSDLMPDDRSVGLAANSIKFIAGFYYMMSLSQEELKEEVPNISFYVKLEDSKPTKQLDPNKVPDLNSSIARRMNSEYGEDGAVLAVALRLYDGDFEEQKTTKKRKMSDQEIIADIFEKTKKTSKDIGSINLSRRKNIYRPMPLTINKGTVGVSIPSKLEISYAGYDSLKLQAAWTFIVEKSGGRVDENGDMTSPPTSIDKFLSFMPQYASLVENWLNSSVKKTINGQQITKTVAEWAKGDLKNPGDYGKFVQALASAQWETAVSYVDPNSKLYKMLGGAVPNNFTNLSTTLSSTALLEHAKLSISAEAGAIFDLDKNGDNALYIYVRQDGRVGVTNKLSTATTGLVGFYTTIANVQLSAGVGGVFSSDAVPEGFVTIGGQYQLRLSDITGKFLPEVFEKLSLGVQLAGDMNFSKDTPVYESQERLSVQGKFGPVVLEVAGLFTQDSRLDQGFFNNRVWSAGLYYTTGKFTVGTEVGSTLKKSPITGQMPLLINIKFNYNF